jgi:metal-responsive CopG/Arc/MetJ family transcriptional regulator
MTVVTYKPNTTAKSRQSHKPRMQRIDLRINKELLLFIDGTAKQESTTRSELIRTAIYWYLMPQHRDASQSKEEYIFETLKHRRQLAASRKWLKDHGQEIDVYDG